MKGRNPAGMIVVNCGQNDRSPKAEFDAWLRGTLTDGFVRTGLISGVSTYVHEGYKAGETEHLVLLETEEPELAATLVRGPGETGVWGPLPAVVHSLRANLYRRTGPEFCREQGRPVTGVLVVETRCIDITRTDEFNDWYNGTHVWDQLGSGCYHTAYRYQAIQGKDAAERYVALYETDAPNPDEPSKKILRYWRPKWVEEGRWSDLIEVTGRAAYFVASKPVGT